MLTLAHRAEIYSNLGTVYLLKALCRSALLGEEGASEQLHRLCCEHGVSEEGALRDTEARMGVERRFDAWMDRLDPQHGPDWRVTDGRRV